MTTMATMHMAISTAAAMAGSVGEVALGPWAEVLGGTVLIGVVSIWVAAWRAHRRGAETRAAERPAKARPPQAPLRRAA